MPSVMLNVVIAPAPTYVGAGSMSAPLTFLQVAFTEFPELLRSLAHFWHSSPWVAHGR